MSEQDIKLAIQSAINAFSSGNLTNKALLLFKTMGYNTDRQNPFPQKTYQFFKDSFLTENGRFNEEKALVKEWISVDLLFQLTKDEVSDEKSLFDTKKVNNTLIETYLFFVIELKKEEYSRTALAQITREVNKVFPMPAMIIFKYGSYLTLSVINRRLNKRDIQKDVLEKVTLVKDISINNPHRAHIEIFFDLYFEELKRVHRFTNFVELHNAWQKTLDTKELNKRFYRELSTWYFWASGIASFPNDIQKDNEIHNATNLIRLLTRILFVYFIKEKHLVPELLFDENGLKEIIKDFNADKNSRNYYNAILQNLFFATLNQKMDERGFATDGLFVENKKNYGIKNLYRYGNLFLINNENIIKLFKDIPFLNGGLFDCLDIDDNNGKILYEDGFSRNPKKQAVIPDFLFFGEEQEIDLSSIYDDRRKNHEKVKGLIKILSSYKFTVAENTPIEEDIALDPELLGNVFENLLASYNPETKTTARKQTGSFYTPREIVNYMVDESLKTYLKQKLEMNADMPPEDAKIGLEFLISYNEQENLFDEKQTAVLINAIDTCKIIDPACGSGAFPMGILHKLVYILHKLDSNNKLWKERQIAKAQTIDDTGIRDNLILDIETAFNNNELDYGRKLYLIENCIYGVDIQPIAIQISKLRFFISLIVDQKTDKSHDNFGIRPLPNLETKFVAANTLIGIEKPQKEADLFKEQGVRELEEKLKDVRHRLFSAKTSASKRKLKEEDRNLREEISNLLIKNGCDNGTAHQLAGWNPYNQNASSSFFDAEWMFGVANSFDIVIGNPPYVRADNPGIKTQRDVIKTNKAYETLWEKWDLYVAFIERSYKLLTNRGILEFIIPDAYMASKYAIKSHAYFLGNALINRINFCSQLKIFEAGIRNIIIEYKKMKNEDHVPLRIKHLDEWNNFVLLPSKKQSEMGENIFKIEIENNSLRDLSNTLTWGEICYVSVGLVLQADERLYKGEFVKDDLISEKKDKIHSKSYVEGKCVNKYVIKNIKYLEWDSKRVPSKLRRPTFPELYTPEKILMGGMTGGIYDCSGLLCNHSIIVSVLWKDLKNIKNRSIDGSIKKDFGIKNIYSFRNNLEENSDCFNLKYLLAILNSRFAYKF